jgi:hypothetical protein
LTEKLKLFKQEIQVGDLETEFSNFTNIWDNCRHLMPTPASLVKYLIWTSPRIFVKKRQHNRNKKKVLQALRKLCIPINF